jgi:hypothetical protein
VGKNAYRRLLRQATRKGTPQLDMDPRAPRLGCLRDGRLPRPGGRPDRTTIVGTGLARGPTMVRANSLSDDLDPGVRLVDVEHVRGAGQRDLPRLGQQVHDELIGPHKRGIAEVALDEGHGARDRADLQGDQQSPSGPACGPRRPVGPQPCRHARVPTASRYSFSKRALSSVPRFHSSQKSSSAALNSASRPLLRALPWATIVGP